MRRVGLLPSNVHELTRTATKKNSQIKFNSTLSQRACYKRHLSPVLKAQDSNLGSTSNPDRIISWFPLIQEHLIPVNCTEIGDDRILISSFPFSVHNLY